MPKIQFLLIGMIILCVTTMVPSYGQGYYDQTPSSTTSNNSQQNQVQLTDKGSIKVGFYTDPTKPTTADQTKFYISFVNKDSDSIQPHIDYKVFITKGTDRIFGTQVTHTAEGSVTVPFQFTAAGTYKVAVEIDGILFQPIPPEIATFTVEATSSAIPEFPNIIGIILVIGVMSMVVLTRKLTI